jgi:hypothetical protein
VIIDEVNVAAGAAKASASEEISSRGSELGGLVDAATRAAGTQGGPAALANLTAGAMRLQTACIRAGYPIR